MNWKKEISRRRFLRMAGVGVVVALGLKETAFFWEPDRDNDAFIEPDQGHKDHLRRRLEREPIIKKIADKAYMRLLKLDPKSPAATRMGEAFRIHLDLAQSPELAVTTFAIIYSPYFPKEYPLFENPEALTRVPKVYPLPRSFFGDERFYKGRSGWDRAVHLAQHQYLTNHYLVVPEDRAKVPRALQIALEPISPDREKALAFSAWAGGYWELKEKWEEFKIWWDRGRTPQNLEEFDPYWYLDLWANKDGATTGVMLADPGMTEAKLGKVFEFLNREEMYRMPSRDKITQ